MLPVGLFGVTRTIAFIREREEDLLCFSRRAIRELVLGWKVGLLVSKGSTWIDSDVRVIS
jgi:hypothetical protein